MARVLYINDCHRDRTLASLALTAAGHDFADAQDGEEALAGARRVRPDCIVVNPSVAIITGDELLQRLHMLAPDARFVVLGYALREQTVSDALARGASACLSRPYDVAEMIDAVTRALASPARVA